MSLVYEKQRNKNDRVNKSPKIVLTEGSNYQMFTRYGEEKYVTHLLENSNDFRVVLPVAYS